MGISKNRFEKEKLPEVFRQFGAKRHWLYEYKVSYCAKLTSPSLRATSPTGEDTSDTRKANDARLYHVALGLGGYPLFGA